MAKRPCPFDEHCAPMVKVHVSSDDLNKHNQNYMREIHAKTINKLFQGMNNNNRPSLVSQNQTVDYRLCSECRQLKQYVNMCWFCETTVCHSCWRICNICSENFCSRCTVAIYKNGNNYNCLTCYN